MNTLRNLAVTMLVAFGYIWLLLPFLTYLGYTDITPWNWTLGFIAYMSLYYAYEKSLVTSRVM
jgi:hypothetical protein